MNKMHCMSDTNFRAIQAWYANTPAADVVSKLELIIVTKQFPDVVNFVCDGKPRYFIVDRDLVKQIAKSHFTQTPITPAEGAFLDAIKDQITDRRTQIHLDANDSRVVEVARKSLQAIRVFEAPCPREGGYKRYVVDFFIQD